VTQTIAILVGLVALAGFAAWLYLRGRSAGRDAERSKQADADRDARDRVADVGSKPRGPEQVEDALRKGGF
jgi:hypothetical protein